MCKSALHHEFLQALPKCEHHLHIEGSLSPTLLFQLAASNNIALPTDDPAFESPAALEARYENFTSLDDFLHYYYIGMSVLLHPSDYEALATAYFERAHADGVHHAEIFFDPQAHTERGVAYEDVVAGLAAAQSHALRTHHLTSALILCFLRHLPLSSAQQTFTTAHNLGHFTNHTITGIGLDSSELPFPPTIFTTLYTHALSTHPTLHRTAHAGEEAPSTYISSALDQLKTTRIDHGIRLVEDDALMARVAKEGILLTVCPLSNVRLKCVTSVKELPIRRFLDEGVQFSINSDDPAYFGGYVLDNYCAVQEGFGLSAAEWKGIAVAGVRGSWCDQTRKDQILASINEWTAKYEGVDLNSDL